MNGNLTFPHPWIETGSKWNPLAESFIRKQLELIFLQTSIGTIRWVTENYDEINCGSFFQLTKKKKEESLPFLLTTDRQRRVANWNTNLSFYKGFPKRNLDNDVWEKNSIEGSEFLFDQCSRKRKKLVFSSRCYFCSSLRRIACGSSNGQPKNLPNDLVLWSLDREIAQIMSKDLCFRLITSSSFCFDQLTFIRKKKTIVKTTFFFFELDFLFMVIIFLLVE